ncbi:acyltransferase family protein, partial [Patescibacteria group bacterium]|nr:acyltransferase family protein [Patescibacteria group bacterium]
IVQFYILLPFLMWLFKKYRPMRVLLACMGLSFVYRYAISVMTNASPVGVNEAHIWLFVMFPSRLAEFALGMYLALEINHAKIFTKLSFSLPMIALGFLTLGNVHTMFMSDFLFGAGGVMLVYAMVKPMNGFVKKILDAIGRKSYIIYLYHEPIMGLILKFIFPRWIN